MDKLRKHERHTKHTTRRTQSVKNWVLCFYPASLLAANVYIDEKIYTYACICVLPRLERE
jgi:hypothetical protein